MRFAAILFDLDDTLHDRAGSLRAFVADQQRRWLDGRVEPAGFIERLVVLDANGHLAKSTLYPRLLDELNIADVDPAALAADYGARYQAFARPRDDALGTLAALRRRGIKLGVMSNGWTDFQLRTLVASGLEDTVDAVLISQAEGLRKPDRRLFERAAVQLGVATKECLFVGDNPVADIDGARGAGMRTAWIRGGFDWPADLARADWDIDSLAQLLDIA